MKDKILHKASEMFLNLGFKSVTMDDIANDLGVSKKTIYKYFKTKHSLVESVTKALHDSSLELIEIIVSQNHNPIKENFEIKKVFKGMFKNASSSLVYQLKKYYPVIHEKIMEKEIVAFSECLKENLEKGIKDGFYRENINVDLVIKFYIYLVFSIHENTEENHKIPYLEIQTLNYHTRAIATEKGVKELEKQLEINNL